ncbi:nucleotidyltransferase family protein [Aquimarina sp. U1-2]|uniref:nucleotidyltransferase family protein n=1 Tax=Aquimarina sp. U1-2 TaxID=2823141 RepID=UPI001AECD34D|nr:nucleotidyltransferase family protein [Aquimarina sp. U1-2]MBP2831064.1 nucleotidyltransferase family protein [Aquimarina sp. U1-2]
MIVAILVLAAGASSRMGQPKQLLQWKGTTLIRQAMIQALSCEATKTYVVTGAYHNEVWQNIENFPIEQVHNPNWKDGLASSIRIGIEAIEKCSHYNEGVVIKLVDQPAVDFVYLNRIIKKAKKLSHQIIATAYNNTLGIPALFKRSMFEGLKSLEGDVGASSIIKANQSVTHIVKPKEHFWDMDTPEEYKFRLNELISENTVS